MTDTNNNTTKPKCAAMEGKVCKPSRKLFEQQCRQLADEINNINTKLVSYFLTNLLYSNAKNQKLVGFMPL